MFLKTQGIEVAVIGAGIAGASCARWLAESGCRVQVIDKSRGMGGRLATRRLQWTDTEGRLQTTALDHGAPGFAAQGEPFQAWVATAVQAGVLAPWRPTLAPGSRPLDEPGPLYIGLPDMPAACRWLLQHLPFTPNATVERLRKTPAGWLLEGSGPLPTQAFNAVVLALPPAQAAPLLAEYRRDWAQRAAMALMQPGWTLMGVSDAPPGMPAWDAARPQHGPLAWVLRHAARPGRQAPAGEAHWVLHARAGWSRQQLEQPPSQVQAALQAALQGWLQQPLAWRHAVVHRWRYALPMTTGGEVDASCWWDAAQGLGACGDFLGGGGVEAAWASARALVQAMRHAPQTPSTAQATAAGRASAPALATSADACRAGTDMPPQGHPAAA
ncbi:NAD(P)/FAD-dependent oxidoreductase [Aquincola sp. J276]|uniref:NAD(P)/FAD-dependent oxidoreductase n=1 Tax=Aquincola sp. J276 TaxID=2898432 RepID=UPI002151BBD3|nr:FAD-dependent oxidoreductase [Aquincola sp. J276]MCR5864696.1 FAD-dependent oxidoreductase [Aquincola sp. J276]